MTKLDFKTFKARTFVKMFNNNNKNFIIKIYRIKLLVREKK